MANVKEYGLDCNHEYDFFGQRKKDFHKKFSHESILCQGKHRDRIPLVTILITTYKRPELLRQALESALNQKGFDDYQIIIADNEGRPIEEETPTAQVVKEYTDEKVIYYRHSEEVSFRMDSAAKLAKSPWIVFLHDDDLLAENHLMIMTEVIKKHKEIKFLACAMKSFSAEDEGRLEQDGDGSEYRIYRYLRDTTCFCDWTGLLGALINRKCYIAIGGTPSISMGMGDVAFVANFLYHFGTYKYSGGKPLYFYRVGEQQATYFDRDNMRIKVNEFFFYKYVVNKYHKLTHKIWERNVAYLLLDSYKDYYTKVYQANIDFDFIISECGMPPDILKKGARYYAVKRGFFLYKKCIWYLAYAYEKIKKSDIYLVI